MRRSDIGTPNDPAWYEDDNSRTGKKIKVEHPLRRFQMFDLVNNRWKKYGKVFSAAAFLRDNEDMTEEDLPSATGDERTFGGGAQPLTKIKRVK